ncbi:ferritin family protein [Clostridium sp. Marseille-Q7071]
MSYTTIRHPEGMVYSYDNLLRQAMIAELVAINDYSEILAYSDIKELNNILEHILEEEKEHYGKLLNLLRKVDEEQYYMYRRVLNENESKCLEPLRIDYGMEKKDGRFILDKLREEIKGELEAIVLYEDQLRKIPDPEGRTIIYEIIMDEKEHVEELTQALLRLDKHKYGPISRC